MKILMTILLLTIGTFAQGTTNSPIRFIDGTLCESCDGITTYTNYSEFYKNTNLSFLGIGVTKENFVFQVGYKEDWSNRRTPIWTQTKIFNTKLEMVGNVEIDLNYNIHKKLYLDGYLWLDVQLNRYNIPDGKTIMYHRKSNKIYQTETYKDGKQVGLRLVYHSGSLSYSIAFHNGYRYGFNFFGSPVEYVVHNDTICEYSNECGNPNRIGHVIEGNNLETYLEYHDLSSTWEKEYDKILASLSISSNRKYISMELDRNKLIDDKIVQPDVDRIEIFGNRDNNNIIDCIVAVMDTPSLDNMKVIKTEKVISLLKYIGERTIRSDMLRLKFSEVQINISKYNKIKCYKNSDMIVVTGYHSNNVNKGKSIVIKLPTLTHKFFTESR